MSSYDEQYQVELTLFGEPYREFINLIELLQPRGEALDLGCGQGRDALMLAQQGLSVTGVDVSKVGISQMVERAASSGLSINGIVGDFFEFPLERGYDVVVLDSILHFAEDKAKEWELMKRITNSLNNGGYIFIFIHKSKSKERELKKLYAAISGRWEIVKDGYINYVYEEKATNFRAAFQFYMFVIQRIA